MKKFIYGVLALVMTTLGAQASSLSEVIDNTYRLYSNGQKVCTVQNVEYEDGKTAFLTAQHCVRGAGELSVYVPDYDDDFRLQTEVYQYLDIIYGGDLLGKGEDVSILEARAFDTMFNGIDLASPEQIAELEVGDEILVVGYPSKGWSDDLYISTGQFLGYTISPGGAVPGKWIKTSAPVDNGSSGGGLYLIDNDEYYLVSVTSQKDPASSAPMSYFTDPAFIQEAFEDVVTTTAGEKIAEAINEALELK